MFAKMQIQCLKKLFIICGRRLTKFGIGPFSKGGRNLRLGAVLRHCAQVLHPALYLIPIIHEVFTIVQYVGRASNE